MVRKIKEVSIESKKDAENAWVSENPGMAGMQAIRRVIHRNKSFLRQGGLVIVNVDWDLYFNIEFFMGYKFIIQPRKIEIRFCAQEYSSPAW